jgi:hypothetical protein
MEASNSLPRRDPQGRTTGNLAAAENGGKSFSAPFALYPYFFLPLSRVEFM